MRKALSSCLPFAAALLSLGPSCSRPEDPQENVSTLDRGVTNGTPATDDPAVVGLVAEGRIVCTGVLVAPRVALTAAHCLVGGASVDGVLVGLSIDEGSSVELLRTWVHPGYEVGSSDHDLGVLLLQGSVGTAALPLNEQPLTETDVGRDVRIVGFGAASKDDTSAPRKRQGTSIIGAISPLTLSLDPSPSQPCSGDSGGPVLWSANGEQVVLGIVSHGDADCSQYAHAVRVDAQLDGFVRPLIARIAATSSAIGERCILSSNCASGLCLSPSDAPSFSYCSRACGGATECAPGMECAELPADGSPTRACQFTAPSPGALGAPCAEHTDCEFGLCELFVGAAAKTCSALCFQEDADSCPHGGVCTELARAGDVSGCFLDPSEGARREPSDGCGIARPSSTSSLGGYFLLLGCAIALGRPRRAHR